MKPTIIIVGADKGGVGKTTITRVLLDYLKDNGIQPTVFDTEGALSKFYPYAKVIDIEKFEGQMQVFETMDKPGIRVVDMKAGVLSKTIKAMGNAGLLAKATQGETDFIVLHILGSDTQSMGEIVDTNVLLSEGAKHYLVENQASDGHFFRWNPEGRKALMQLVKPNAELVVPHLDSMATEDVDLKKMSYANYIKNADKKNNDWLVRNVQAWRAKIYKELDKIGLVGG